jgi:tRNA threonylcarbamoyladenosine biosynthesis protein TsaB
MSVLLAFDTSTEQMSIGLRLGQRVWTHEGAGGAHASAHLLPTILSMLKEAELGLPRLDAIAFGRGPGAFTGLRTACSVTQGLALGASKPALAIDTLMAIAEDARTSAGAGAGNSMDVWVTLDARMNQIYAAHYLYTDNRWSVLHSPALVDPGALNAAWTVEAPSHIAGNALPVFERVLQVGAARCHPQAAPRAAALLGLANSLWSDGATLDAEAALPTYLRDKVAQTITERNAARGASAEAR